MNAEERKIYSEMMKTLPTEQLNVIRQLGAERFDDGYQCGKTDGKHAERERFRTILRRVKSELD